ncbi:unnamed protein product [Anisakis simplex]|uniref:Shugoshin_C domain-containing protein n=1 Tax=Anisakis simplex TaxID=6269 RepID=A0A0M3K376_ANISI|nr:unnamed protein product [Anisakis simplex]
MDLAGRESRIRELEAINKRLMEQITEMENAEDERRIELIANRRVQITLQRKVKLIKTAALKSIGSLQRFVDVIDKSTDNSMALSSSQLFEKEHSPIVKTSLLEIVPESPSYSPHFMPLSSLNSAASASQPLSPQERKRSMEKEDISMKKIATMAQEHVESPDVEVLEDHVAAEESPVDTETRGVLCPYVTGRSKRRSPSVGNRGLAILPNGAAVSLQDVSSISLAESRNSEEQENSRNGADECRSNGSSEQDSWTSRAPFERCSSGRPMRRAASKIKSLKEPSCNRKLRREE